MRHGYHLVTDCLKANQANKPHKDVEATIILHLNIAMAASPWSAKASILSKPAAEQEQQ